MKNTYLGKQKRIWHERLGGIHGCDHVANHAQTRKSVAAVVCDDITKNLTGKRRWIYVGQFQEESLLEERRLPQNSPVSSGRAGHREIRQPRQRSWPQGSRRRVDGVTATCPARRVDLRVYGVCESATSLMVAKELGGCSLSDVSMRLPTSGVILFVDVRIRLGGHGGHLDGWVRARLVLLC